MKSENVILDLDNTLISAEAIEDFPWKMEGIRDKAIQFPIHDMDGYYIIFERPYLQTFLDWLFENYNVSIWTAASKDYALFIIDKVVLTTASRKLDHILFSYHCDQSRKKYEYAKKLDLIFDEFKIEGYSSNNTLIIDDLDEVYECQPRNAISVYPFEILESGSEKDNELPKLKRRIKMLFNSMLN
jgi:TFIIF-interacting CTD phosphatase-like protein